MNTLTEQINQTLTPGMVVPIEFEKLFDWIEGNKYYIDTSEGRIGYLFSDDKLSEEWTEQERPGGTIIEFYPEGNINLHYWFDSNDPEILNRLCVFAKTGAEGSMAAFWLDDNGNQKIVHMGSGSGSVLTCVLADNPIDFLRLIAIGYDEICWNEEFSNPPNFEIDEDECFVHPNKEYQEWVINEFNTNIPKTANEIVKHPSEMGDINSNDAFCKWLEKVNA